MRTVLELKQREYLTPGQCARVFGRGRKYWVGLLDRREILGFRDGKNNARYIQAASARKFLAAKCVGPKTYKDVMAEMRERARQDS